MRHYTQTKGAFITFVILFCIILMCLAGCKNKANTQPKYYLNIPDSPNAKAWIELDSLGTDTAYCNWYANPNNYTIRINKGKVYSHHHYWYGAVSFTLMEGNREVSTFTDTKLDSIILNDNQ